MSISKKDLLISILVIMLLMVISYFMGGIFNSKTKIEYIPAASGPAKVDTVWIKPSANITEAKVDSSTNPITIIDSLLLDDIIAEGAYIKYRGEPYKDMKGEIHYKGIWDFWLPIDITPAEAPIPPTQTIMKNNWKELAGSCLFGGILGAVGTVGTFLYLKGL